MHTAQLEEFTLRTQIQQPIDVIRAATTTAAKLLNLDGQVGTLAVGARADLLILDGDPLEDITALTTPEQHLRYVIRAGQPIPIAPQD
jgi:imidazolonepropionase-like amidohydrolase